MKKNTYFLTLLFAIISLNISCNGQSSTSKTKTTTTQKKQTTAQQTSSQNFVEGSDYTVFNRVRMMDNTGFTAPVEAYSILLPKGWSKQGEVIWIMPGQSCAGTNAWLKASSADGQFSLQIFPNTILSFTTNQQLQQWNMANPGTSPYCRFAQPVGAEQYLRGAFVEEIGRPQILKVESNAAVVAEMQRMAEKGRAELMQYGASDMQVQPSAINAEVKWSDGSEGFVMVGAVVTELTIPNVYTGGYDKSYTTSITKKTVFKYPAGQKEKAAAQFAVIMAGIRSNDAYTTAINSFWKQVRQQSNRTHWEKIKLMDEQTRQMGEATIAKGNARLKEMDNQMRSWEARQSSGDRMHTEFIKTIREVENFRDETGKYEMTSGYNHAWSRGDGTSFVLSDNPNFNAASVFQDQNWKQMKKVN